MKKTLQFLTLLTASYIMPATSEPAHVPLADYAFDFATYGHEITVIGTTKNYMDKLTADDFITINDEGYTLKALIDRMNRKDRQGFISFFNDHCIVGFGSEECDITASGDIELNQDMMMIFRMSTTKISKDGSEWSNAEAGP